MIYKFKIIYGGTLESTIKQYVNDENVTEESIINNNYDNLENNNELKKLVYQALIKSHKNKHIEIKDFILNELKNREISILSLNTLYNSENNLNKIKVLNFVSEENLVNLPNLLDVLDIVEIVNPYQLNLDNYTDLYNNLNIALASGDGTFHRETGHNNAITISNVEKYHYSARIHIYLPKFFDKLNDINFNWIIKNNFQNNILIIWLDILEELEEIPIPESFINLFRNQVDYITSDDLRYNISPKIANSILKPNGFIKVSHNDKIYSESNFFLATENSDIIDFYKIMFEAGCDLRFKIYKKK